MRMRVFKSGNSLAIRLPKSLGFEVDDEVVIVPHADGGFSMWKAEHSRATFMSLYGSMSEGFMAEGRGNIHQVDRDWTSDTRSAAA